MRQILRNKQIVTGGLIVVLLLLITVLAPLITNHNYSGIDLENSFRKPSADHIFGTDLFGRDLWTRIVFGSRVSLLVSLISVSIACVVGGIMGLLSGYFRGLLDLINGRLIDILMAFPALLLSLILGTAFGTNIINLCIAIGIPLVPSFYRIVRGETLTIREKYFVKASKSMGNTNLGILYKHIIPNTLPQVFVIISFNLGSAIMAESSLGFLGFSVPAPMPSWGLIINEGKDYVFTSPWVIAFGGSMIALTVLAFNLMGDGLRDYLDPKLKA